MSTTLAGGVRAKRKSREVALKKNGPVIYMTGPFFLRTVLAAAKAKRYCFCVCCAACPCNCHCLRN